jgi:hypothetical protein
LLSRGWFLEDSVNKPEVSPIASIELEVVVSLVAKSWHFVAFIGKMPKVKVTMANLEDREVKRVFEP